MASIPGLADAARVTVDECVSALRDLSSPDEFSASKDFEGRRISEIDGGWILLNYLRYRNTQDREEALEKAKERQARFRAKKKGVTQSNARNVTETEVTTEEEEEEEAEEEKKKDKNTSKRADALPPSEESLRLADELRQAILEYKPDHKLLTFPSSTRLSWAKVIDRMLSIDKRSVERVRAAIAYLPSSVGDGGRWRGWAPNVQSAEALRKHFDKLESEMQAGSPRGLLIPEVMR